MQRLRHPIRSIREPFGKAGLTVAILALVFAMVGGAWAAVGLNTKQKKEVTKIAKKYAGKAGAPGAAGTNGTNGTNGKDGAGSAGKSVVTNSFTIEDEENAEPAGVPCGLNGGNEVEVEDSGVVSYVCNGSPWTATGALPEGATETGAWKGPAAALPEGSEQFTSVSFTLPVSPAPPTFVYVAAAANGTTSSAAGCDGVSGGVPQAASGKFCVYARGTELAPGFVIPGATVTAYTPEGTTEQTGAGPAGARLKLTCPVGFFGACNNYGVWAVTG